MGERLGGEYLWLWIALFASVILYIPVHFWMKGRLSIPENGRWLPRFHEPKFAGKADYKRRRTALAMLA